MTLELKKKNIPYAHGRIKTIFLQDELGLPRFCDCEVCRQYNRRRTVNWELQVLCKSYALIKKEAIFDKECFTYTISCILVLWKPR